MSMPAASGCTISKVRSPLCILRIASRRCLRFISCHRRWVVRQVAFSLFSCGLGFMLIFPRLNSTWLGPVGETDTISPAGSGLLSFAGQTPPPSTQSPIPEPCSHLGQERSRDNTALTAEPGCVGILIVPVTVHSVRVSGSYNHPEGVADAHI